MFNVTYYDTAGIELDIKVDVIEFLTLLEVYSTGESIEYMAVTYQGKNIDCNKLLSSLKFV